MYQSLEARLHDAFWAAEGPPAELPLMRTVLQENPGRALEIGCGSGRLLLPLLAEGFEIEGLDNSPEMLALLREDAERRGLEPDLQLADLGDPLSRSYQSILVPAFTLQLVDHPLPVLESFLSHLLPKGVIYLTLFVPYAELEGETPPNTWTRDRELDLPGGERATIDTRYHIDPTVRHLHRDHHYQLLDRDGAVGDLGRCRPGGRQEPETSEGASQGPHGSWLPDRALRRSK